MRLATTSGYPSMSSHEQASRGGGRGSAARLLGLALVLLLCGGAASLQADWTAAGAPLNLGTGELRIGIDATYPPLAATAPDGGMYGLEIDLSHELARRLGVPLRLTNTDLGGGLDALAGNQFDGLLAGLSRSPDLSDRA